MKASRQSGAFVPNLMAALNIQRCFSSLVLMMLVVSINAAPTPSATKLGINSTSMPSPREDLLRDLARVFGVVRIPAHLRQRGPPLFFRRLFDSMTLIDGQTGGPAPYQADTILGYPDRATTDATYFQYDVTQLERGAQLKNAELHLFRMKRRPRSERVKRSLNGQLIEMKLYQVTHPSRKHTHFGNVLLDARIVPKTHHGWIVFNVAQAVRGWLFAENHNNYGFLVVSQYQTSRMTVERGTVYFAQRGQHHDRLQPSLAVYSAQEHHLSTNQNLQNTPLSLAFARADPLLYDNIYRNAYSLRKRSLTREKRSVNVTKQKLVVAQPSSSLATCRRYSMYVDFRAVGWDEWIISPRGFNAYHCNGICPFPLGQQFKPSNHAVVQSIVNALSSSGVNPNTEEVAKPCCVPDRLASINMLYYDDKERVVLKQYDGMRALTCACR